MSSDWAQVWGPFGIDRGEETSSQDSFLRGKRLGGHDFGGLEGRLVNWNICIYGGCCWRIEDLSWDLQLTLLAVGFQTSASCINIANTRLFGTECIVIIYSLFICNFLR